MSLPPELLDCILSHLNPEELARLAQTCSRFNVHATDDHMWHRFIQANLPTVHLTSPYPFATYHELYWAHEPRWFLPRYKIWVSNRDHAGKLVIARYDQRRGCIEGYQLVAVNRSPGSLDERFSTLQNKLVALHSFSPDVGLHLDKPILHLPAVPDQLSPTVVPVNRGRDGGGGGGQSNGSTSASSRPGAHVPRGTFRPRVPMGLNTPRAGIHSSFVQARPVTDAYPGGDRAFLWPSRHIPARHRFQCFWNHDTMVPAHAIPTKRSEASEYGFHVRRWMERHQPIPPEFASLYSYNRDDVAEASLSSHLRIVGETWTYATLDPALYTPTPAKPWRGIWVGDYSDHGCEFILMHQPDDDFDPATITQHRDETDADFARRKHDETVYRGQLLGIKLTGDPNVPRGEISLMVDDLGPAGRGAGLEGEPFDGVRSVKCKGHVAAPIFMNDHFLDCELMLMSHDELALCWKALDPDRHIVLFYKRLDIDQFLDPQRQSFGV